MSYRSLAELAVHEREDGGDGDGAADDVAEGDGEQVAEQEGLPRHGGACETLGERGWVGGNGGGRGLRGSVRRCVRRRGVPCMMPSGMMNMLATECSRPSATKAEIRNQIAVILPVTSLAKDAR